MKKILRIGREPGRSSVDRSVLTARRGRFSPVFFHGRPVYPAGRSLYRGQPLVSRHLHGLKTVVAVCLAGFFLFVFPPSTSGEPGKARSSAKASKKKVSSPAKSVQSRTGTATKSTTSRKPDYKTKYREKKPPPANGSRPRLEKKPRPGPRNPKEKTPRPNPPAGGGRRIDPVPGPRPGPPWPIPIIIYPQPAYFEVYDPYYEEDEVPYRNVDLTNMLLTSATLVWNAFYIHTGQPNEFVATAGFITGASSLVLAFSDKSDHAATNFLLGIASITFSVLNLAGGFDGFQTPVDQAYYDSSYSNEPRIKTHFVYSCNF